MSNPTVEINVKIPTMAEVEFKLIDAESGEYEVTKVVSGKLGPIDLLAVRGALSIDDDDAMAFDHACARADGSWKGNAQ